MTAPPLRRPQPVVDDVASDRLWAGALEHRLIFQRCSRCDATVFYPRRHCPTCGHPDLVDLASAGNGSIHSYTMIRVHPDPYFAARAPYAVALVELDEGFRMLCEVVGDLDDVQVGARVSLTWDNTQPIPVPLFELAEASPGAVTPPPTGLEETS